MTTPPLPAPLISYEAMLTDAMKSIVVDGGTVTSAVAVAGNTLTDTTKNWGENIHQNRLVRVIKGAGVGQTRPIASNTNRVLVITGAWVVGLDSTSVYVILNADLMQMLRDVFGGGANIGAANPIPVDISPGLKATQQIMTLANLALGATSTLANCTTLDLRTGPVDLALTVVATYNAAATLGLRVHVRTSPDNANWDSEDYDVWTAGFTAGIALRETVNYVSDPMYLKVLIENLDPAQTITNIAVIASLGA